MASNMTSEELWDRFQKHLCDCPALNMSLDISRMTFPEDFFEKMQPAMEQAFKEMEALEAGAIANPDEERMVGHYWLRAPDLAPTAELKDEIRRTQAAIQKFAADVHAANICPPQAPQFKHVLSIGIGGSALGPEFVHDALGTEADLMSMQFIDNTDPEGIARVLGRLDGKLSETLCVVISKSGGTPETRNGYLHAEAAYKAAGLEFSAHAVAITGEDSKLDKIAVAEKWLARFPMWDWVGGRTSELSAVGLLPAALQGIDILAMLDGAEACDVLTREHTVAKNPAALLALMWHHATEGRGTKDMVVLPYKDRLLLFSRYLQQLVMESLGKRLDLKGERVDQGIAVYGNKGSTDQHAYIQQLRDGVNNFFATFIRVLEPGGVTLEVDPGVTAGDYLHGFLLGTRTALFENDRQSMTISIDHVSPRSVGVLIALFERAVGFYASLIGINAYHQPGVEAGKKAAASILDLQAEVIAGLRPTPHTAAEIAAAINQNQNVETVYLLLEHLTSAGRAKATGEGSPAVRQFFW